MPMWNSTVIRPGRGGVEQDPVSLEDQFILGDSTNVGVNSRALRVLSFSLKVNQL